MPNTCKWCGDRILAFAEYCAECWNKPWEEVVWNIGNFHKRNRIIPPSPGLYQVMDNNFKDFRGYHPWYKISPLQMLCINIICKTHTKQLVLKSIPERLFEYYFDTIDSWNMGSRIENIGYINNLIHNRRTLSKARTIRNTIIIIDESEVDYIHEVCTKRNISYSISFTNNNICIWEFISNNN